MQFDMEDLELLPELDDYDFPETINPDDLGDIL
ncbi:hypothetical protein MYOV003v1_p0079 [Vibrio phage 207E48.1]|nr:hypothetical protein MYOV003v1_p0079 [Vibrio phage 207E48.1]